MPSERLPARALPLAWRRLRRGARSGELLILALAVAVAVASHAAVALFSDRMSKAIASQTGETLGADFVFSSRQPIPDDVAAVLSDTAAATTPVVVFPSVVFAGENSSLASIKAVTAGFPLRGRLTVAERPFDPERLAERLPARGEAWADARLWQELNLDAAGAQVQVGSLVLRLTQVVVGEPGRGAGFTDLAPRLLMNLEDLAASGLLAEGSRAQYAVLAAGDAAQREALAALELPERLRRASPQESRPELRNALSRADTFLAVASSAASLLAAAAIALCAWQFGLRLRDEVALMKCLGAGGGFILRMLFSLLVLLALAGGAVGALLGWGGQAVIAALLGELMQIELPPPSLWPLAGGFGLALLLVLGFATPPLLTARDAPPARVFQRSEALPSPRRLPLVSAVIAVVLMLAWQTGSLKTSAAILGGALILALVLAGVGSLLIRVLAPLRATGGTAWRFGLGNLVRRRGATLAQLVALGVALVALILVGVVQRDLLNQWQARLPPETPNLFFINIQPEQVQPLTTFFAERGITPPKMWPQARGRLTALNGVEVTAETFDDPETQRWINRDFNLSWSDTLNPDNRVHTGEWWGAGGEGQPWLSIDDYVVERLGVGLGDALTMDFAGEVLTLSITNIRSVQWDSFQPNFFLLAPPGTLEASVPTSYISSVFLLPEQKIILRDLVAAFPNVSALDIESLMNQVRGIMERIVRAVEFIFLFALAAGLLVLLAAIEGTRGERAREAALLRALGGSRRVVRAGLIAEYAVLGLLAGFTAAFTAQVTAWLLAVEVFQIPYGPRPLIWLFGGLAGALLVIALGWATLRRVLATPPAEVLRQGS
jgi:putative ABC transport system permease protein